MRQVPAQLDCPFSLVWVARPAAHPREQLPANLADVDRLYTEVKRSRPVRPAPRGGPVGKCNQCGVREALGPTSSFEAWRDWAARLDAQPDVAAGTRLAAGERLCAVCLVRRFAGYADGGTFPSTRRIAAASWMARCRSLGDSNLNHLLEQLKDVLDDAEEAAAGAEAPLRQKIDQELAQLGPKAAHLRVPPPRYLAVLAFDGDEMGRRVRLEPERMPGWMNDFAERARTVLASHQATSFYLAGDEGLALAPAAQALPLALELRALFTEVFRKAKEPPTLSLGLAWFEALCDAGAAPASEAEP